MWGRRHWEVTDCTGVKSGDSTAAYIKPSVVMVKNNEQETENDCLPEILTCLW